MSTPPLVSIVVPTAGRAGLLRDCLNSLCSQDFPSGRYEVIVVADGAEDAARRALEGVDGACEINLVGQPVGGPSAARNTGVRTAKGNLVCFVDDDVEAPRSWLRALVAGARSHPDVECFGGAIRLRLEGDSPRTCGRCPLGETELDLGREEGMTSAVWSANMVVRREAFERIGLFDETLPIYYEEVEWQARLCRAEGLVVYLPEAWLWHRRTRSSLRLSRLLKRHFLQGIGYVAYRRATGEPVSTREALREARGLPGLMWHACSTRCWRPIFSIASQGGGAYALVRHSTSTWGSQ